MLGSMTGHDMCQSFNTLVDVTGPGETTASTEFLGIASTCWGRILMARTKVGWSSY